MPTQQDKDAPPVVGLVLARPGDNGGRFTVTEVFPTGAYPGMILEWYKRGSLMPRGQVFTTKNWRKNWRVVNA